MELKHKHILLISPEPWDHIFVSKHHYAVQLASESNKVFFLNPPATKWRVQSTEHQNVFSVHYAGFPKGLRFYPRFIQKYFNRRRFAELEKRCKVVFDIIWSFDNSVFFDFEFLPKRVTKICHIVDQNQDFQFAQAASTADVCFGVIPAIVEKLSRYNKNSFLVTHGVQAFPLTPARMDLPGKNRLKALYLGNLDMPFINWSLLLSAAKQHHFIDFIFIGPLEKSKKEAVVKELQMLTNVSFLPAVPASAIPHYLASADLLLIAYKKEYNHQHASPHKMMEYFASGKMVVCTWLEDYVEMASQGIFFMENDQQDFVQLLAKAVHEIESWNADDMRRRRRQIAQANTYREKLFEIDKFVSYALQS